MAVTISAAEFPSVVLPARARTCASRPPKPARVGAAAADAARGGALAGAGAVATGGAAVGPEPPAALPPGSSFVATCPGAGAAGSARRASTSFMSRGRASGLFASICATSSSSGAGTDGTSDDARGAGSCRCATMTWAGPLRENGGCPVIISNSTHPSA